MQITKINFALSKNLYDKKNKINKKSDYNMQPQFKYVSYNPSFMATMRVDKGMERFYEFNKNRIPTTVQMYLGTVIDKFSITPLEAQKEAFKKLKIAKTVEEVQSEDFFPEEELFIYLKKIADTDARKGLLGIYREFKDIYDNGILSSGDDFTVYLLRKIFAEAKTIAEINEDLDNDLNTDIKNEYQRKYKNKEYIKSSTLRSLGIYMPDTAYLNSLKFTRDGYSDAFGLKISEAQQKYWNSLSEDQRFEILSKRCEGRDNWWNNLSYNEKLEYAAGIDSDNDLYKNYRKFVNSKKRELKSEQTSSSQDAQTVKPKRIRIGSSNLKDKDIFVLWFKKNIEKFYEHLSEADKDSVHIKRVRKLAMRWQEMSPEEKTDLINKMKSGREPGRFVMIDAWNHSRVLIRELSDFLQSQQIFRPINVLYSSEEFSEFQSKIMTQFWAEHRELAEEFGRNIKRAQARVEDAISRGQFEDLKQEIMRDRAYRIKLLERERYLEEQKKAEEQGVNKTENSASKDIIPAQTDYKQAFISAYSNYIDSKNRLPKEYKEGITQVMLEKTPQEVIEKYTKEINSGEPFSYELMQILHPLEEELNNDSRFARMNRALEAAVSHEMYSKGTNTNIFGLTAEQIIKYLKILSEDDLPPKNRINPARLEKYYKEYVKDSTDKELSSIYNNYFETVPNRRLTNDELNEVSKYLDSYGRSLSILFSDKSPFTAEVKSEFNNKFLSLMPSRFKEIVNPLLRDYKDIVEEKELASIRGKIAKRFNFVPNDVMDIFTKEICTYIRMDRKKADSSMIQKVKHALCYKSSDYNQGFITVKKDAMSLNDKKRMLAAEQAMADILFKVTKDEEVYSYQFEQLITMIEMLSDIGPQNRGMTVAMGDKEIFVKEKPNISNLKLRYINYLNDIKENESLIYNEETNSFDKTELLFSLNPADGNHKRDEYIMQRISAYIK